MDRVIVVVFDSENKAIEARMALWHLDTEDSLTIYADAVIQKKADGTTVIKQKDDQAPLAALAGTFWGSFLGLFGGPIGLAVGAGVGLVSGVTADLRDIRLGHDFIEDVNRLLLPNHWALVAEIDEGWTTPLDTSMEALGGAIIRRSLSEEKRRIHDQHIDAMKADLAQMKAEQAKAHADRKAKLQDKINQLDTRLQAQLQKAKEKREASEREEKAKVEVLKAKAAAAKAKVKAS